MESSTAGALTFTAFRLSSSSYVLFQHKVPLSWRAALSAGNSETSG